MDKLRVLVAAAGRGTRAGLPYPKTLFPIQGKPILVRIAELLAPYDAEPTVIVSPDGEAPIRQCLAQYGVASHLVVQPEACGMGDAVLRLEQSPAFADAEHVLLIWGDVPFIQPETVARVVAAHRAQGNDFTFATRLVDSAYTVVSRDTAGQVTRVIETREEGVGQSQAGERDIGLFVFRKTVVLDMLREELAGKWGKSTGEHGFLYIIGHLVARGYKVAALPVATELDLVSLNSMNDIGAYL
ncbi:MAG: NTP transferase domain-containing protein [Burkholderiaceae bacterium]|nr:NTP transferase domain-containing protein [Burkholderiaceae bacterium]